MSLPSLLLIAQTVFRLERGQTDRHTDKHATYQRTHASAIAGVSNSLY